jgi:amino acid adenylation domain-containing protein
VPPLGALGASDDRPAVVEPGRGWVSYAALDRLADGIAGRLRQLGVEPGARIGIYARRSCDAIAVMLGTLRAGCTYVPVDPAAPVERNAQVHTDCGVRATIVEECFAAGYREATRRLGGTIDVQPIGPVGLGRAIREWARDDLGRGTEHQVGRATSPSELACILYTSGSTGRHKGWMMSRTAIETLVRWGHGVFRTSAADVFANHAPFSFGMSLFDIYSSLTYGAALVLLPDEVRQFATHVVDHISRERVTIFFATPAILSLIAALDDLEARDLSALRLIVFGGEVFPAPPLRTLRRRLSHLHYFNCWGSTETNIGTYYQLDAADDFDAPPPIGRPCEHYEARVVGIDGEVVTPGTVGELQLRGAGLTTGYLNQPTLTGERLIHTADGRPPWYRTCDLVVELPSGDLRYAGRIGRMVKLRGYRVEPGEIETRLHEHPHIKEVSVVPVEGPHGVQLVAHLSGARLSIIELKEFCAAKLPPYMVPERFVFHAALPRTSRGKIDFQRLRATDAPDTGITPR